MDRSTNRTRSPSFGDYRFGWWCTTNGVSRWPLRVVFNDEIYNHRIWQKELAGAGYKFLTRADTEVLPPALDYCGVEHKLRGMFAYALYTQINKCLLMARNPFGIKPRYVGYAPGLTVFGSEPKTLLTHSRLDRQEDPVALLGFFTLVAVLSPRTCWSNIQELEHESWLRRTPVGQYQGALACDRYLLHRLF